MSEETDKRKYIRKIGGSVPLFSKNCEHVVDTNGAGDIFCTVCGWRADPQILVDMIMKALAPVTTIDNKTKRLMGWT